MTSRAVTLRLAKGNDSSFGTQGPLFTADRTALAALRARLFLAQELALLSRCCFQRSLGQSTGRRTGDFLHLCQSHIEPPPLLPKGMLDDNFSPRLRESADCL